MVVDFFVSFSLSVSPLFRCLILQAACYWVAEHLRVGLPGSQGLNQETVHTRTNRKQDISFPQRRLVKSRYVAVGEKIGLAGLSGVKKFHPYFSTQLGQLQPKKEGGLTCLCCLDLVGTGFTC